MTRSRFISQSSIINVMIMAAEKAGQILVRDFNHFDYSQYLREDSKIFIYSIKKKLKDIIINELQKARPDYLFVQNKESIDLSSLKLDSNSNYWIINPLDGEMNFVHGIPQFSISISLQKNRITLAELIFNPITDEIYWGEKGRGAYLNQNRIRVSNRKSLEDSLVSFNMSLFSSPIEEDIIKLVKKIKGFSYLGLGSDSLTLAFLASGKLEACIEPYIPEKNMTGSLLISEAGGYVNNPKIFKLPIYLMTNSHLFGKISSQLFN